MASFALVAASCGSGESDDPTTADANDTSPPAAADTDASANSEAASSDPAPAEPDSSEPATGESSMVVVLNGETLVFDVGVFCVPFGPRFMGGSARTAADDKLDFSYEFPDLEEDGADSSYANDVTIRTADDQASWKAGTFVSSSYEEQFGDFTWSREGDTLTGSGTAENQYTAPPRATTDIEVEISC